MKHAPTIRLLALWAIAFIGSMVGVRSLVFSDTIKERGQIDNSSFVVRIYYDDMGDLVNLHQYDVWEYNNLDERYVLASVNEAGYLALLAQGWRVDVDSARSDELGANLATGLDFLGAYRTVEELYEDLAVLNSSNPSLSELVKYGESYCLTQNGCRTLGGDRQDGFPLYALRITNENIPGSSEIDGNRITRGTKPVFFLMANIHAREITTPEIAFRFIEYLLDGYGQDADATWIVDHHEIWVVPTANPDGHWLVELGHTKKYGSFPFYQRKNANNDADANDAPDCPVWPPSTFEQYGIDLNRNHSFGWGPPGSSNFPCNMTFRGPSPGSEPEVAALEALVLALFHDQRGPALTEPAPAGTTGIFITLHSYSNLILWPWGNSAAPAPNKPDLKAIGDKLSTYNNYFSCQPSECLYLSNGTSDDWAYGVLGIPAFTFEIGNQFMPSYSEIDAIQWPENKPAFIYAAKIARTPYMTVHGPDAIDLVIDHSGPSPTLSAIIDDGQNGEEDISAAFYSIDVPPWQSGVELFSLNPVDGSFDSPREEVTNTLDLSGIAPGKHIVYVLGEDEIGHKGAVSAIFIEIETGVTFEKAALQSYLTPGGTMPYVITLSLAQGGNNHSFSADVIDVLPDGLEAIPSTILVDGTPQPGIYDQATGTIRYQVQGVFNEQWNVFIEFTARASESISTGQLLVNESSADILVDGQNLPLFSASAIVPVVNTIHLSRFPVIISTANTEP